MIVSKLLQELTIQEKITLLSETAPAIERLGIPEYHHGNEALHGVVRPGRFTVFPQAIGMAASFNIQLIEDTACAISDEARGKHNYFDGKMVGEEFDGLYNGLLTFWSPNLNTARDPRWGRTGETYGEDPYLVGECGKAFVIGLQGRSEECLKTVATPKHFTGNNEEHNRFECDAQIPRKQLFEYYLPPFEAVVKEGRCEGIMGAYNAVNGIPCHGNPQLLGDILRGRWGFEGYVVSDCGAVSHLWDRHYFAQSPKEAASIALRSGVDLECGSCGTQQQVYKTYLYEAYEDGLVTEQDINQAAERVLRAREKLGILGEEKHTYDYLGIEVVGCEKHRQLARDLAKETIVLLKNEPSKEKPLLPIMGEDLKICVIGNQADQCQFGDYSGQPVHEPISILDGIRAVYGEDMVFHVPFEDNSGLSKFNVVEEKYLYHQEDSRIIKGLQGTYHSLRESSETAVRIDEIIQFDWENMAPDTLIQKDHFVIIWNGIIIPQADGIYEFHVKMNEHDCSRTGDYQLYVDERPAHLGEFVFRAKQKYKLHLVYKNGSKRPSIQLLWRRKHHAEVADYQKAAEMAKQCDMVIACLGLGTKYEAEGRDKIDLNLPVEQIALLQEVYKENTNIVVILYNGSSLTFPWITENIPAIVESWYPGEQGGRAIADIIFGKDNPSGRLPLSFYKDVTQLPPFDCYDLEQGLTYWYGKDILYPFGYGLSYTTFAYDRFLMQIEKDSLQGFVELKNVGERAGYEVIQIYVSYMDANKEPYKLQFFKKVWLEAGEKVQVPVEMKIMSLRSFDAERDDFVIRLGRYGISLHKNARETIYEEIVTLEHV